MNTIKFYFTNKTKPSHGRVLKQFIKDLIHKNHYQLDNINVIGRTDEELLEINRNFLDHDFYTDIITFPISKEGEPLNAELYISTDRVLENSEFLNVLFEEELRRVIFHGILHLIGFNDKTRREKEAMTKMENVCLNAFSKIVPRETS